MRDFNWERVPNFRYRQYFCHLLQVLNIVCLSPRFGSVIRDVLVSGGFEGTARAVRDARDCSALLVFNPLLCLWGSYFGRIADSDAIPHSDGMRRGCVGIGCGRPDDLLPDAFDVCCC